MNDCVFRAVKKAANVFGVDIESTVFDRYNNGQGIDTFLMPGVIEEAINPHGLTVKKILVESIDGFKTIAEIKENTNFLLAERICFGGDIVSPAVLLMKEQDHVEAYTGFEEFGAVKMAICIGVKR